MSVLARIAPVAMQQHAAVHLRQILASGGTLDELRVAVRLGQLTRRAPEVYVVAGAPRTCRQDLMVAVLDAGAGAAVSHRAAAMLLGLARRGAPEVVEITVTRLRSARLDGVLVHRSRDLVPEHVAVVDGIPCTGPLRTLVDLGAVEPRRVVADALERALHAEQVTIPGVEWMLTRLSRRGRDGCGTIRRALDERALCSATPQPGLLEPRFARIFKGSRLPAPDYQHKVFDADGEYVGTPDFAYPAIKEAIEVDGFEAHGTPNAMTSDFEREHRLRAAGWNVTRFTWFHVVRRPRYVLEVVAGVLGAHNGV